MIQKALLLFLCTASLFSANLLTFKVYERSDRVDLLLTFDTPYNGRITQKKVDETTTLILHDALYATTSTKEIISKFINSFTLEPLTDRTAVHIKMPQDAQFEVSKTVDNYGLRLRFHQAATLPTRKEPEALSPISKTKLETATTSSSLNGRYLLVVGILFLAVLALYFVKRKVAKNGSSSSWLFKKALTASDEFEILFQKPLDQNNRVVMIKVAHKQYLAIIGNTNVLLDRFNATDDLNEEGFENVLRENQQELDRYLQLEDEHKNDALQSYKDKASLDIYRSQM